MVCHGIPDSRKLRSGDIVNLDITVYYKGYHGDLNETFFVGKVSEGDVKLVQCAYESLRNAIAHGCPCTVCVTRSEAKYQCERHRQLGERRERPVRLLRGPQLLRARHRQALPLQPHGSSLPKFVQWFLIINRQQRKGKGATWHGVHDRAHDQRGNHLRQAVAGQLDGRYGGWKAIGTIRAHDPHHGDGMRDPDRVAQVLRHLEAGDGDASLRSRHVPA